MIRSPQERFFSHIRFTKTCWIWLLSGKSPYGFFWIKRKQYLAHRWIYEHINGKIPKGMTIDHLCKNKRCVNPAHLEVVTSKENTMRADHAPATINSNKTHCPKGHEYTEENTYRHRGSRHCKKCKKERSKNGNC